MTDHRIRQAPSWDHVPSIGRSRPTPCRSHQDVATSRLRANRCGRMIHGDGDDAERDAGPREIRHDSRWPSILDASAGTPWILPPSTIARTVGKPTVLVLATGHVGGGCRREVGLPSDRRVEKRTCEIRFTAGSPGARGYRVPSLALALDGPHREGEQRLRAILL